MSEIKLSPDAISDLRHIREYLAEEFAEKAADDTLAGIMKRVRQLSVFPESGAPLSSIIDIETDYRFLVCGNYMAFYRVKNDVVYVVRVLYGKSNFMRTLFGDRA